MNKNERDEHFKGVANLQYPELARLFVALYSARVMGDEEQVKQIENLIKTLLSQRAYDLIFHLLQDGDPIDLDTSGNYGKPEDEDVHRRIANLPDLTEWPPIPPKP